MFIVWGRKLVHRKMGYVADFCSICRAPKPFELRRVGSAGHVYYVSVGEGQLVGYERLCQECKTAFRADPTVYASISKASTPLADLTKQTFPNIDEVLRERLALEKKIKDAPMSLSADERHVLIRNPFLLMSPKVEKRFASIHIDMEVGLSLVAAATLVFVVQAVTRAVAPDAVDKSALVSLVLGILLVAWQGSSSGRRFMVRKVIPVLATTIRPLKPTEDELKSVLAELSRLKHKIGTKLKLADLLTRLNQPASVEPL
jgi:hypothetical protein